MDIADVRMIRTEDEVSNDISARIAAIAAAESAERALELLSGSIM